MIVIKGYIVSVISAAILSGIASVMAPERWRKYVGIISGVVILCTIIAPISKIKPEEMFSSFELENIETEIEEGENHQMDLVKKELTDRINSDIEERLKNEFGLTVKADAEVGVNEEGKITGVTAIKIKGKISERAAMRLCEVYGVEKVTAAGDN